MSIDPLSDATASSSAVWKALHERLVLHEDDFLQLQSKRGFSPETITALGFRSSRATNRPLIESLLQDFPLPQLAQIGIFIKGRDGVFIPNPQFCGFGLTGKKNDQGAPIWSNEANPVLIPYFDAGGQITTIRPHKGNLRRPDNVDRFLDDSYSGIHPYSPYLLRTISASPLFSGSKSTPPVSSDPLADGLNALDKESANQSTAPIASSQPQALPFCVITEGEFKAAALWQCGIPAIAFPGIQSLSNNTFCRQVVQMLRDFSVREVIVVFDNEIKDDPTLPNYKPDPWKRYDSIVYARYTSKKLWREANVYTRIGFLPDDWRVHGKADWDGALAAIVKKANESEAGTVKARKAFLKVLADAMPDKGMLDLFPSEAQRIIEAKLSRLYHRPQCLSGGDEIRELAQRFRETSPILSSAFFKCIGRHYVRKPVSDDKKLTKLLEAKEEALKNNDKVKAREIQERINGIPQPISNFTLSCDFKLVSADGNTEYLVKLHNVHNEKTPSHVRLSSGELSKLSEFRKWCLNLYCTWAGGEKDLQDLSADMQAASAFRAIHEIDTYGWSEDCRLWKFGDRAYTTEGKMILPDKNRVFWHEGVGYQTDFNSAHIGDGFEQGAPILGDLNIEKAAESFLLLSRNIFDAIGDYDGWLALGGILAYAAHPEIYKTRGGAPGVWITGRRGSGKSTICRWLVRVWGFPGKGIALAKNTTDNFVSRELAKYGALPAWLDEFDHTNTSERVQDMLKAAFDRHAAGKATFDQSKRTRSVRPITTPLVSGETGTRNAATRSRYLQIMVLRERAIGSFTQRLKTMNAAENEFSNLGHFLIANRTEFARRTLEILEAWFEDAETAEFIEDPRHRLVSGAPYAAWKACIELLEKNEIIRKNPELHEELFDLLQSTENLRRFTLNYGSEEQQENTETTYINQFWQDIYSMLLAGNMKSDLFQLRYAKWNVNRKIEVCADNKPPGYNPVLFMAYDPAYLIYEQEIRKTGRPAKMSLKDIRNELRRERYWLLPQEGQTSHRVRIGSSRYVCWCLDLNEHPIGENIQEFLQGRQQDQDQTHFN